ncbi:hypothetical protein L0Y59_01235 [Candidatus Uhrbacteria bacterium]|nr:hypothetical protein [Candidatus Uhrbacteria bacterium]
MHTNSAGSDDWGHGVGQEEDLNELGVSVKESGDDDLEEEEDLEAKADDVLKDEEEEPLDGLQRLEMLEKTLDEPPVDIGDEE